MQSKLCLARSTTRNSSRQKRKFHCMHKSCTFRRACFNIIKKLQDQTLQHPVLLFRNPRSACIPRLQIFCAKVRQCPSGHEVITSRVSQVGLGTYVLYIHKMLVHTNLFRTTSKIIFQIKGTLQILFQQHLTLSNSQM